MSFSHWLNNLKNRIQPPAQKRKRRNGQIGHVSSRNAEALEDRVLLTIIIDSFNTDQALIFAVGPGATASNTATTAGADILGGERDLEVGVTAGAVTSGEVTGGSLLFSVAAGSSGTGLIAWDGADGLPDSANVDHTGLGGVDLTEAGTQDAVQISLDAADVVGSTTITVFTDAANFSTFTQATPVTATQLDFVLPYSGFSVGGGTGADFSNVGAITLSVSGTTLDAEISNFQTTSTLAATMADALLIDNDFDGLLSPGDTLRYTTTIANPDDDADAATTSAIFDSSTDSNTSLVVGSVTTSQGTVTTGNTGGDTTVSVDVGTIADNASVTVTFDVLVDLPLASSVTQISTQGVVTTPALPGGVATDDQSVGGPADATVTAVTKTTLGGKIFNDADRSGGFSPGDIEVSGVTVDVYFDADNSDTVSGGDILLGTLTTNGTGDYSGAFPNYLEFIVDVTDTGSALTGLPTITAGSDPLAVTLAAGGTNTSLNVGIASAEAASASIDGGGNLVLTETGGGTDDSLTISHDGTNIVINDPSNLLADGGIAGATGDGTNTLTIPKTSFTGGVIVNSGDGDDTLTIDLTSGNFDREITFNGGGQTSGDELTLMGGGTFASVAHSFANASDGSINVTGNSTINYTGLEPINDNLNATDRVFEFTGADEQIMLTDDGDIGDGQSFIDSDLGESVTFNNPTGSLTIDVGTGGGSGMDLIEVSGLDSMFDADLTINGENDDLVVFAFDPTDVGTGDVLASGIAVGVVFGGSITTNGGSLTFESAEEIFVAGNVSSNGGEIIFNADTDQAVTPGGSVIIEDAMVLSGGGNIVIGGGADPTMTPTIGIATAPHPDGVYIHNSTVSSGAGDISIRGSAANDEDGVDVGSSSTISATTGSITIIGDSTGMDDGIDLHDNSTVSTTTGPITLTGTSTGATAEDGVIISGNGVGTETTITTQTGAITITGIGANEDSGVEFSGFVIVESTGAAAAGAITIDGTSDTPDRTDSEAGTSILESIVRSVSGAIDIAGTSATFDGLAFDFGSSVQSSGTGAGAATITLTGNGGEFALVVSESTVSSVDGNIMLDGTAGTEEGTLLFGGVVESTGTTADAATITIGGTSTDGFGVAIVDSGGGTPSQVNSVSGAISITGDATGGAGAGAALDGNSNINSTGMGLSAASITINGTSGAGRGVDVVGVINSVDGAINITGDASNGTEGVFVDNSITATGTGPISITGTGNAASGTPTGVFFDGDVSTDSGMITVLANAGRVAIDSDQSLSAESGNVSVTTTDTAATGDNIELAAVSSINSTDGNITLISGDDVLLPMTAALTASVGTIAITVDSGDADTAVGGNADLMGLVFSDSLTGTGGPDNDLIRLPSGMFGFNGVATLTGNGGDDTLTGGGGADSIDGGAGADSLDGAGGADTLSSGAGNDMITGGAGADLFQWNIGDGSDSFDGGADADSIETGTGTVTLVTHTFVSNSDGSFGVDAETVTYTNIEPIADNLDATNRIFTFTGGAETISLTDDGDAGDGQSMIDSTLGEVVTFNNPSALLTIGTASGSGIDDIRIEGLDSLFDGDLTIDGDGDDTVSFQSTGTDVGTGNVTARGSVISVFSPVTTVGGNIIFESTTDIFVLTQLNSGGGNVIFNADTDQAVTPGGSVTIDNSPTVLSGGGDIIIGGGANPSVTPAIAQAAGVTVGVSVRNAVLDAGAGNISIRGSSDLSGDAVGITNSTISSTIGSITIAGESTGGTATRVRPDTTISTTSGDISVSGLSSGATALNGVVIMANTNAGIMTQTGAIDVTGTAGTGTDGFVTGNGVEIAGPFMISSTGASPAGGITITGDATIASGPFGGGLGTSLTLGSTITSVSAPIMINGTNPGGDAVSIDSTSSVESTGTGLTAADITITGNGGAGTVGTSDGIHSEGSITSADGDIQLTGSAPGGDSGIDIRGAVGNAGTTGNITLITDSLNMNDATPSLQSSGDLLIVPENASTSIGIGTAATGDLNLNANELAAIVDGFRSITIGDAAAGTGAVDVGSSTFTDPVTIVGGPITVNGPLSNSGGTTTLTATSPVTVNADITSTGDITITATDDATDGGADDDDITIAGGVTVQSSGGNININAGDDFSLASGSTLGANGPIIINIDSGNADASGGTVTVSGDLASGAGATINGDSDADTFDVTPSMMATIDLLGDDPTMAPGDTVNFMTPAGQSVALTPDGADGGTFSTSGGFQDVTFDEIEAIGFAGDSLIVNSGGEDDLFDVTLTGAGAGTLAVTTDVDAMPGPSATINIMFSGLERLVANGEGGDDVFRQNNTGGPLGLMNGVEFNGGAGSDTLETLGGTATNVIHTFTNSSDGSITIDTFGLTYTGLEPILDTITATSRTFTFAGTDDDITLADLGGGMSRISSVSSSETVDFTNPTGSLTINAGDGADTVDGSASAVAVTINGGGGADDISGTPLADAINGDAGSDTISGGVGNDAIDGGADDDLLIWNNGDGSDMLDGGAGTDELEVNGSTVSPAGDTITISANAARFDLTRADGGAGLGPFTLDVGTVETLDLNTLGGDDSVTVGDLTGVADLATLQIDAGAGNDTVDASALPDLGLSILIEGGDDDDTLTGSAGSSMINGNMGNDSLIGGAAADTIMGGGGDDVMDGGAGGDMLSGQAGDDSMTGGLGDDTMNGGANTDRIVESRDADVDLGDATLTISPTETDTLVDVEEADLNGGASANTIDASDFSGTATLMGGDNDDTITGAMGSSVINGNMGNDSLTGLDADDTLMGGGNDDVMDGGAGGDMLTGQAGDDTMTGGLGDDTLNGGADTDQIIESGDTDFDLGDTSLVSPLLGTDTLIDVEEADLTGGASANTIDASDFTGVATLMGGDNDDTITGAMGASAINGNMGNDELTGLGAADTLMGGGGDDLMDGGAGDDMLTGQADDDTMTGGLGDDTLNGGADTDLIVESGDTDFDLGDTSLVSPMFGTDTLTDVEEADLTGGASANTIDASDFSGVATLTGNDGDDTMTGAQGPSMINGNMGNDSLLGLGAADGIMGGGGNDVIDGGAGNDTLTGQANDDTITGNTGDDNIMGGDGADLINGSLGNDTISGDAGDDRIQGSNHTDYPGNPLSPIPDLNTLGQTDRDSLLGGAGSDTIAGAIGADFIDGEADADIIDAQSGGDTTNGIDTIVGDMADFIFKDPEDTVL